MSFRVNGFIYVKTIKLCTSNIKNYLLLLLNYVLGTLLNVSILTLLFLTKTLERTIIFTVRIRE